MSAPLVLLMAVLAQPAGATMPGVTVWVWDLGEPLERWPTVAEAQTPNAYFNASRFEFVDRLDSPDGPLTDMFAGLAWGWLLIEAPGTYLFRLYGDDGARLVLDGHTIIDTDWGHQFTAYGSADLEPGLHRIEVPFYEDRGRFRVQLDWRPPGRDDYVPLASRHLRTEAGQTFVTAPGRKRFFFQEDPRAPGDGRPLDGVHPSFDLQAIRPPGFEPAVGGLAFLPDGRLAISTWDDEGAVYLMRVPRDRARAEIERFAAGLGEPLGLAVVDGEIYVAQRQEITRLRDTDADGVADRYEVVAGGWPASHNYHEFTFNLLWLNERFYTCTSVPLRGGHTSYTPGSHSAYAVGGGPGSVLEIDPADGSWRVFASGLRTPNGLALGPDGELFGADNQGSWLPSSRINHLQHGGFYGHQDRPDGDRPAEPPVAWLPQDEIGNSPAQLVLVPDGAYRGQMLVGDVTHGGLKRLFIEQVHGAYQAAVFRFSQGLEAGINRLVWGPDGALYVGGIGADGNWHHQHRRFGLQRLVPNGTVPFEMLRVESRRGGFTVTFTEPAPEGIEFAALQWRYRPTVGYGGPKLDVARLSIPSSTWSADRRQVFLAIPGLEAGRVVHLRMTGPPVWTTECWYTLNEIADVSGPGFEPARPELTRAPPHGSIVLFDGQGAPALTMRAGGEVTWPVRHGELIVDQQAGDVVSRQAFGDCLLHVEWYSPPGGPLEAQRNGNSGVKLQSRYEVQIMNTGGRPRPPRFNEAGSIYRQKAADVNASTGPGTWQTYDIWFTAPRWAGPRKERNARMTVYWNGVLVHDDVEVIAKTGVSVEEAPGDHPILLQAHASDAVDEVRFRNVWVLPDPASRGVHPPR